MTTEIYTRDWLASEGHWDIGYFSEVDPEPSLAEEVGTALSLAREDRPLIRCEGEVCRLIFDFEPTAEQKTIIDQAVADHKAAASV